MVQTLNTTNKDSQKEMLIKNSICRVLDGYIPEKTLRRKNNAKSWEYGYDKECDVVVISKTGQVGQVVEISGLQIALPLEPNKCYSRSTNKTEQYWERAKVSNELTNIQNISEWNKRPKEFKNKWIEYIEQQFDYREQGFWFMNNGVMTYITGSHWMYLQWSTIDVGYPDYREANRIFFIYWEACKADNRCYGIIYLKIRRSGFSFMEASEVINIGTLAKKAKIGILSKTGQDAKDLFVDKVVPINSNMPFFFKPIMDGMDKPKTELSYRIPASKITRKNMWNVIDNEIEGLDTIINWKNTENSSYDSQKLILLAHDESAKWLKPNNIITNWTKTKTCLRLGSRIVGKCMMGSTSNALSQGGKEYKILYENSNVRKRTKNNQTQTGLYSLFIPMEWNYEGYIDKFGMPVFRTPEKPIIGIDGELIHDGAIDTWENEVDSYKNDPDILNEHYRQYPRTESHAFRDESKQSLFNLTKIYQQIDYNESTVMEHYITRGNFSWKDGVLDSKVIWTPDETRGKFLLGWIPPAQLQNNVIMRNGVRYPGNAHIGSFGCDSYDISAVVDGRGSNGSLHGETMFHMDTAPINEFFLEYIDRPQTAEIFFENVLMALVFYGMPMLAENNKPRLLYHLKNRGYRQFSINRPDKHYTKLSKTERELGGIPNSSQDVIQCHASAIESYIERYIGFDMAGTYRDPEEIGTMPFNRTLEDWSKFDINNRTKHDASISSGLAIMANQKHIYIPEQKISKISVNFARYNNVGLNSEIVR